MGWGEEANSHLLDEKMQPSEENKKPLPLLPWKQLGNDTDALQEAALEQSWGEGFLSTQAGELLGENVVMPASLTPADLGVVTQSLALGHHFYCIGL